MSASNTPQHAVLLIGGKDAGKSNFLFRFWLRLERGEGALACNGLPDEMQYLRIGSDELLKGKYAGRTSREVVEKCTIPVKDAGDLLRGELFIPDCNGEKFDTIFERREWGAEWDDLIGSGTGCLLFVRADSDQVVPALDWIRVHHLMGSGSKDSAKSTNAAPEKDVKSAALTEPALPDQVHEAGPRTQKPPQDTTVGTPKRQVPTQVVLVEWLQFLRQSYTAKVGLAHCPRIGIVVSAWDVVSKEDQDAGPEKYILDNFPLLSQFIATNARQFDLQVFGVSVSGGDFATGTKYRKEYLKDPNTAGYIVHTLNGKLIRDTDHTLPVAWAMGLGGKQVR